MSIRVARGVLSMIRERTSAIVLEVKVPDRPEAAAEALRRAIPEIAALDGGWQSAPGLEPIDTNSPKFISPPLPTPQGAVFTVDGGSTPYSLLKTIPGIIARHLEQTGVEEATIAQASTFGPLMHRDGRGPVLGYTPNAAVLRMYPPPPTRYMQRARIPANWFDKAEGWLSAQSQDQVMVHLPAKAQFTVTLSTVSDLLDQCQKAGASNVVMASGDLNSRLRAVNGDGFGLWVPSLALAAGGPEYLDDDLLVVMEGLKEVARDLAPQLSYAFINIEPTLGGLIGDHPAELYLAGGMPETDFRLYCDELVFEAFPYQILGPGHIARLKEIPQGARDLPGGKFEVALGDHKGWLIDRNLPLEWEPDPWLGLSKRRSDPTIQDKARKALEPCLALQKDAMRLRSALYHRMDVPGWRAKYTETGEPIQANKEEK